MNLDSSLVERLRNHVEADRAIGLLQRAVQTPTITGNETALAELLVTELTTIGATEVRVDEFLPGRTNVHGTVRGSDNAGRLLLIGHTDTVHVRGWSERWAGTERESPFSAAIVGGALWGRGSADLKAGICAALSAMHLLRAAGIEPAADIEFAFVGDEESGERGSGVSAGIKALVENISSGSKPDFAIYVEPTQLDVFTAQIGFVVADISITGRSAYFGTPELGIDALKASHKVLSAIWSYSDRLAASAPHPLVGRPSILVTSLQAGGYIAVPGDCSLSLIMKLLPGQSLDAAVAGLERAAREAIAGDDVAVAFSYPAGRDHPLGGTAAEISSELLPVLMLQQAIAQIRPARGNIVGAPYWSESPFLVHGLGIPTVYCAPGHIGVAHTLDEHVHIDEYLDGVLAFAVFLASYRKPR